MTTLTEKWQKGELPDRLYYVKYPDRVEVNTKGHLEIYLEYAKNDYKNKMEVLAEVPTYQEYRNLQHYWVEELEENVQLKEQQESLEDNYNELVCINANLEDNCKTLAQKLLQVKPEFREWLEVNYKEYL